MNYDMMWDIFDVFSKIRMAFFRSLIESLHKNDGTLKNEFSSRKSFSFKPTATNLIEKTIRDLKSVPNDKGYMLIATAPRSEGAAIIDPLQHEVISSSLSIKTGFELDSFKIEKYKVFVTFSKFLLEHHSQISKFLLNRCGCLCLIIRNEKSHIKNVCKIKTLK